jgi:hypothetical protein
VSRFDVVIATAVALLSFSAGSAARPHIVFPWDREEPAMASIGANQRVVRVAESLHELQAIQEGVRSRLADEQLAQWVQLMKSRGGSARDAVKLKQEISDRQTLIEELRTRLDSSVAAQVSVERELRIATDKAKENERAATRRVELSRNESLAVLSLAAWVMLAVAFGVCRALRMKQTHLIHGRVVLLGSLAGVLALLVAVTVGWLVTAATALLLIVGWVVGGEQHHE